MKCESSLRQLMLFPVEGPTWESLPPTLQQALQEVLSLLLEQLLQQQAWPLHCYSPEPPAEKSRV